MHHDCHRIDSAWRNCPRTNFAVETVVDRQNGPNWIGRSSIRGWMCVWQPIAVGISGTYECVWPVLLSPMNAQTFFNLNMYATVQQVWCNTESETMIFMHILHNNKSAIASISYQFMSIYIQLTTTIDTNSNSIEITAVFALLPLLVSHEWIDLLHTFMWMGLLVKKHLLGTTSLPTDCNNFMLLARQ